jgi:PAS domain S-box-containing protein
MSDATELLAMPVPLSPSPALVSILLVDDNTAKRLAIKAVLAPLGYNMVEADSGRAALRCAMAQDFAVILLDVVMPTMDGFETAAVLRMRHRSEMTPIIFVSALASHDILDAGRYVQGAVDFLFTPIRPVELRAKVSVFANLFIKGEVLARQARDAQADAAQSRSLTDAAPIGIFQTDTKHRYVYTNPRWSEITGISAEQAVGRHWDILGRSDHGADCVAELTEPSTDQTERAHRFSICRRGHAPQMVVETSKAISDSDGAWAGWVGTLADVTAEAGAEATLFKARERAADGWRLKSKMVTSMSHQIRTPINGFIGMTDLLLETELNGRQREYAQTARSSGEALLSIINDLLEFSKNDEVKVDICR